MKSSKTIKLLAAGVLMASPLLWSSCADTWNEHYDVTEGGMADQPSLLQNLAADPDLANFYKVVNAIGAADMMASPQQFTVWAPVHFTSQQADSVIAVYNADKAAGLKQEDNKALTQFFYNHTAMYARAVSSLTNDTVRMMNDKYMLLSGTSDATGKLNNNPFSTKVVCNNGILYKVDHVQNFFPNVREYLEQTAALDSAMNYIRTWDEYELNESASVPGGVVDGKTVYLDSVTTLYNSFLSGRDAYIQREDSVYTMIVPSNEVWKAKYEKYRKYYRYFSPDPETTPQTNGLSMAENYCKNIILQSCFFNTSNSSKYNKGDSLCNTLYMERQQHYPRTNVIYRTDTILPNLQKQECSNGVVYIDTKGVIDPRNTFFSRSEYECHYSRYYEIPKDTKNEYTMNVSNGVYVTYDDEEMTQVSKRQNYVQVTAKQTSDATRLDFNIPNTFSNVYYNIYLVTVPDEDKHLPSWFLVGQQTRKANGEFADPVYFDNPHLDDITSGKVENSDLIMQQSHYERYFVNDCYKADTILVQAAVKWNYCSVGLDNPEVKFTVRSTDRLGGQAYREKIYTRTLRLAEFILVPFDTEEEARAAAEDIDAFNDEILQAKAIKVENK